MSLHCTGLGVGGEGVVDAGEGVVVDPGEGEGVAVAAGEGLAEAGDGDEVLLVEGCEVLVEASVMLVVDTAASERLTGAWAVETQRPHVCAQYPWGVSVEVTVIQDSWHCVGGGGGTCVLYMCVDVYNGKHPLIYIPCHMPFARHTCRDLMVGAHHCIQH